MQGAVFEVKNSALYSGGESTTTDYIPKKPVMEHLKKVEMRHQEKVQLYKQYTIDLREKYQKFEVESQRHYANIIKKHQQQTDEIINNKEALLEQMRQSKEESLDELNLLRAKLYKARAEGVSTSILFKQHVLFALILYFKYSNSLFSIETREGHRRRGSRRDQGRRGEETRRCRER